MRIENEYTGSFGQPRLCPDHSYVLRGMPNIGWKEFQENKREKESYGHARVKISDLSLQIDPEFINNCKNWIKRGYLEKSLEWHSQWIEGELPRNYECWLKGAWLAKEAFPHGFRNPIGVFWYPAYNVWDDNKIPGRGFWLVHPGGMRQVIMAAFMNPITKVDALLFNTCGKEAAWIQKFSTTEQMSQYLKNVFNIDSYSITFCADRGTFIPHTLIQTKLVRTNLYETVQNLRNVLKTYRFIFEDGYEISSATSTRTIHFTEKGDPMNYLRCMLVVPYFDKYPASFFRKHEIDYVETA